MYIQPPKVETPSPWYHYVVVLRVNLHHDVARCVEKAMLGFNVEKKRLTNTVWEANVLVLLRHGRFAMSIFTIVSCVQQQTRSP